MNEFHLPFLVYFSVTRNMEIYKIIEKNFEWIYKVIEKNFEQIGLSVFLQKWKFEG